MRALVAVLNLAMALPGVARGEGAQATPLIHIDCPKTAVAGLPLPVLMRVRGELAIVSCALLNDFSPFEIKLRSEDGSREYVFPKNASYSFPRRSIRTGPQAAGRDVIEVPIAPIDVPAGRTFEFLLDLSQLKFKDRSRKNSTPRRFDVRTNAIVPAKYVLEIVDPPARVEYGRRHVEVGEPNAEESKLVGKLASIRASRPPWQEALYQRVNVFDGIDVRKFSGAGREQVYYHHVLWSLTSSPGRLKDLKIAPEDVARCPRFYGTELLLLRYEIELSRKESEKADRTRQMILDQRSNAKDVVESIAEEKGLLKRYKKS